MSDTTENYGQIELNNDRIIWVVKGKKILNFPAVDIRVIGEFTIDSMGDDYFLTLVTKDNKYEIPVAVSGTEKLLTDLSSLLGANIQLGLANVTTWKTRIIYPENLVDQELYEIIEIKPTTFKQRLRKFFGGTITAARLAPKVLQLQELKHSV